MNEHEDSMVVGVTYESRAEHSKLTMNLMRDDL